MAIARTYSSNEIDSHTINWSSYALVGLATVIAAVSANVLFYYIGSVIVTYDPDFLILSSPGGAILFTLVPAIAAALLYAALLRYTTSPARIFRIVAVVVFILSLVPDIMFVPSEPGATNAQIAILMVMHAIAAGVIVGMLTTFSAKYAR